MKLSFSHKKIISDTLTPVSVYLNIRDKFPNAIMLESSDYHGDEHNFSYICMDKLAGFSLDDSNFSWQFPGKSKQQIGIDKINLADKINEYLKGFEIEEADLPIMYKGLFGYMTFETIQHFEDIAFPKEDLGMPLLQYDIFRYILAFNHFNNELYLVETQVEGLPSTSSLDEIKHLVVQPANLAFTFKKMGARTSNCTDDEFMKMVDKGIHHCQRGDVFQIVYSRAFKQQFAGDEFNVYRALRSINPSPYLFYFDYGSFKLFGSSPEAQLIIKEDKVTIHPIAGTFRRTGNDKKDAELAIKLSEDPKENAEHVMLVDLARNDLSRNGNNVEVEVYREVQYFSHVIHLVSKVTSTLHQGSNKIKIIGDTFPAGTLTGAPKYKAMQLIKQNEQTPRSFYGGCIGHLDFNGNFNHAIMIRTFKSSANQLTYQAGAGIVVDSKRESELQEVENKLMALNKAIELAEDL